MVRSWKAPRNSAIYIFLILITLALYVRVGGLGFISLDDYWYAGDNPYVKAGITSQTVGWAFTTNYMGNWHPLTWVSLMADHNIARIASVPLDCAPPNAQVCHITNLLFHIGATLLLFAALTRMTGLRWRSAFVAALFAVHPLHIESVAWVAERKDVLSALFWMLTMWFYAGYAKAPSIGKYAAVLTAFALGLLAKPMLVTLPIALLLLDYWPLKRAQEGWQKLIFEKAPLFALTIASSAVTFWAQRAGGAVAALHKVPVGQRVANAAVAYMSYMGKALYPVHLGVFYPHPLASLPVWKVVICALALVGLTLGALRVGRQRPGVWVGWLWYLVTLVPVIGLVQVGTQGMADRYSYIPLIGIFMAIAFGIGDLHKETDEQPNPRPWMSHAVVAGLIIIGLTALSWRQLGYWTDDVTLLRHTLEVTGPDNVMGHFSLGVSYSKQGDTENAVEQYREALRYRPGFVDAHINLATSLRTLGRLDEAVVEYQKALKLSPENLQAHYNLGCLFIVQRRVDEAITQFTAVAHLDPQNPGADFNLKQLLAFKKQHQGTKP